MLHGMKIKYVINASNDSDYLKLWPYTAKFIKRLEYTPVLIHITDNDKSLHETQHGLEIKIKAIPGIATSLQAQAGRMWGASLFENDIVMTSDIDMLLLNKNYFDKSVENINDDCFVNLTSNAYDDYEDGNIPMCYNVAKGITYKNALSIEDSFQQFITKIQNLYNGDWSSDETYLKRNAVKFEKYIGLRREFNFRGHAVDRIDREYWIINPELKDTYIDCHFLRPITQYPHELHKLLKLYQII
jgi:hypothetical protein